MMKTYNTIARSWYHLPPRTNVLLLTNDRNPRWDATGVIVECLPFRKYKIRLNGSGRVVIRNRRFLRQRTYADTVPIDAEDCTNVLPRPEDLSFNTHEQSLSHESTNMCPPQFFPPVQGNNQQKQPLMERRLLSHNRQGTLEEGDNQIQARRTRSGREY